MMNHLMFVGLICRGEPDLPDWITHIGVAWLASTSVSLPRRERKLVLLGSVLPDCYKLLLFPMGSLGLIGAGAYVELFFEPFSSLLGAFFLCMFAASLCEGELRHSFVLLSSGSLSHLLLDILLYSGPMLLIPLSWRSFELGLLWSENPAPAIVVATAVLAFHLLRSRRLPGRSRADS
jgi:membrane-bound metal-dependent hydrolase YbcI (DUF457 family)